MLGSNRGVLLGLVASQFVLLLLLSVQPALSQTIVDQNRCSNFHEKCGRPGGPNTEKYCCVENDGGQTLFKCCNPYIGLIVGMCVGVPLIILIIVGVIVLYCICAHYQNKNIQRLTMTYTRHQTQYDGDDFLAPPPYVATRTSAKIVDSDLPTYSTTDPYASCVAACTPTQAARDEQGDSGNQSCDAIVMDDIPLLSVEEIRS